VNRILLSLMLSVPALAIAGMLVMSPPYAATSSFSNVNSTLFTPASTQQIDCGNNIDWSGATARTMVAWPRVAAGASAGTILAKVVPGLTGFDFFYNANSINLYAPSAGGGLLYLGAAVTPPDGVTFHRYTLVSNGSKTAAGIVFYQDGVALTNIVNSDTLTGSLSNSGSMLIGATIAALGPDRFNGRMDEVSIWDIGLSSGEEAQLGASGHAVDLLALSFGSHLIFWSRMGDTPDTTLIYFDRSASGITCVPANIAGGDIGPPVP
jgi:hypothetical protein